MVFSGGVQRLRNGIATLFDAKFRFCQAYFSYSMPAMHISASILVWNSHIW